MSSAVFADIHGNREGAEEGDKARDTVPALVIYGDRLLLDELDGQSEDLIYVAIDSLMCLEKVPYQLVRQLYLYMQVLHMDQQQLLHLIDSLFDTDRIPYALINQINLYVATHEMKHDESLWFEGSNGTHGCQTPMVSGFLKMILRCIWCWPVLRSYKNTFTLTLEWSLQNSAGGTDSSTAALILTSTFGTR